MNTVIGLTGNIASGKSMVSDILREFGATILDADLIGKRVLAENIDGALEQVRTSFGPRVFDGRKLVRRRLANAVFGRPDLLRTLNSIMVPIMTRLISAELLRLRQSGHTVVLDAAILVEAGWQDLVDEVWVVRASKEDQLARLMTRDNLSRNEAINRIEAQMPLEEKLRHADVIIDNTTDVKATRQQVEIQWTRNSQNR
jgi:dephospho-CoA kinase